MAYHQSVAVENLRGLSLSSKETNVQYTMSVYLIEQAFFDKETIDLFITYSLII